MKFGSHMLVIVTALAGISAGCAGDPGEPPAGPGAASATDLRPWLRDAESVTFTGRLQYFHCTSERGNYWTWSLDPAGDEDAAEVDVRRCADAAQKLEDQRVTVSGKLIWREPRHFPLLVANSNPPATSTGELAAADPQAR
jgi:hypothetical protein